MKSLLVMTAAVALLASSTLWAQERFFVGATAGVSSTKLSGDMPEDAEYTSQSGFSVGLIGEYSLWDDIRLSLQPSYARRGSGVGYDVGEAELRDSLKLTLDYISVPVMARFLTRGNTWFVNGGFALGFLLKASLDNVPAGKTADVGHLVNTIDLMMIVGVGANFDLKPAILSIELRYGQSLLNAGANDQLAAKVGITPRFRSSGFQLLAGALFPL